MSDLSHFREVWLVDFEYSAPDGERATPACLVAREYFTGRLIRLFSHEMQETPPFATDSNVLFVAYFASAEIGCFLSLGWPFPVRILDLYVEHRIATNGIKGVRASLLAALSSYGLDGIALAEKDEMRALAMRGGPYTGSEQTALLDYCQTDVDALAKLLPVMLPAIDLPRALLRGRYMAAVARMEFNGIPIDTDHLVSLRNNWGGIKDRLIDEVDSEYGVYDGHTFRQRRFAAWLAGRNIPWPVTQSGRLALDSDTFKQQARTYPEVSPLRELRHSLSELKLEKLAVGADRRNRCLLSPYQSRTGRNQPSNNKFIFGPSVWLRGLIKPAEGCSVAYVDWSQQELGIAAALSGDRDMMEAYGSSDPYLAFAKQAGAVPHGATKESHPTERKRFKVCALAVQYGMREHGLAMKLGDQVAMARNLLNAHRETYRTFWAWSQSQVDQAMLEGAMRTVFGWRLATTDNSNPRSLANFPMQANGAEMLRLACSMATEAGIAVCAPVHDAVLIEATTESIDNAVHQMQSIMAEASRVVLDGFELNTDAEVVRWPDRYMDERGQTMWDRVQNLLVNISHCGQTGRSLGQTGRTNGQFVPPAQSILKI